MWERVLVYLLRKQLQRKNRPQKYVRNQFKDGKAQHFKKDK